MSIINLLPDDYLRRRAQHHANIVCSILFLVVMAGVVAAAAVSEQSTRHTLRVRDSVNASYEDAARMLEQMRRLDAQKGMMLSKANETAMLMERVPRSYLLGIITNALPPNTSLVQYDLDVKTLVTKDVLDKAAGKPSAPKPTKYGAGAANRPDSPTPVVLMELTGIACTDVEVGRFIENVYRNPLFASVDLVYSEEKLVEKIPVREFRVRMELKANADAIDATRDGAGNPEAVAASAAGGPP
jgi:hypothetical protein